MWLDNQREAATDIGILERDFWHMTPADLEERTEIHRRREMREWERSAWIVSRILSAWVKSPPSVDELLGRVTDA